MNPVLEVSELTHDYGEVIALRDLDLEVPPGVTGLVGANGAGKTTLLRLMLGLLHPTAGSMSVLGHDPQREPLVVRSRIGYMPEGDCLPQGSDGGRLRLLFRTAGRDPSERGETTIF